MECDVRFLNRKMKFNIQYFAGDPDKTEKATPRRRRKAREEGQIAFSKDLEMGLVFLATLVLMRFLIPVVYTSVMKIVAFYTSLPNRGFFNSIDDLGGMFFEQFSDLVIALVTILLSSFGVAIAVGMMQTKGLFVLKNAFKFDLNKINPLNGFKRMFSLKSVVELLKNLIKLILLGFIGFSFISGVWDTLFLLPDYSLEEASLFLGDSLFQMTVQIAAVLAIIGFADFFYQKWEHERSIRMSKKEIKDEYKDIEGNPEIKRRQKQIMAEFARKRMMEEIPSATVVVTNPTHFAVAIKFELEKMNAPLVVAKGADNIAQRIKEVAKEYGVPIYEDPPLARGLYDKVEIGEEVPSDMYRAVAEVLAFVFRTAGKV